MKQFIPVWYDSNNWWIASSALYIKKENDRI